jgi:hypothetical protein
MRVHGEPLAVLKTVNVLLFFVSGRHGAFQIEEDQPMGP